MADGQRKAVLLEPGQGAHLAWLGGRLRYLAVGEQTDRRVAVAAGTVDPDGGPPPHVRNREHEGVYVLSGELSVSAGNRTLALPAGGFLNVAPGTARRFANASGRPAEVLTFVAPGGFDEFQFRAGLPLARPDEPIPEPTAEDRALIASLAPNYGVDLNPPASAFAADPKIRLTLPGEGRTLAVVGDLYRFLAVSDDTGGRYAIWHATVPAGAGPPPHTHSREDEAFYVLSGTVTFRADGTERRLGPGGFALLPSGTRHQFRNETDATATMLILVAPAGLERMLEATGRVWDDPSVPPGPPGRDEIDRLIAVAPQFGVELHL